MVAFGKTIAAIVKVPVGGSIDNVLADKPGITLSEAARIQIFMSRETVNLQVSITIGGANVYPQGPTALEAVVGTLPSTQDDMLVDVMAQKSDTIIISAVSTDAAIREIRALVFLQPVSDAVLSSAMAIRGARR